MKDSARGVFEGQAVQLKGFRDGLRLMVDGSASIEEIESSIRKRMSNLGDSLAGTSIVLDTGRRALNLHRVDYPGKDLNNICHELETCDGSVRTSLWNEYIATPKMILSISKVG